MLLDRRRVKFWQKWVFLFMAIIMGGFLVMIPLSNNLGCGGATTATETLDKEIAKYRAAVQADATDVGAWKNLGDSYVRRANQQPQGSAAQENDWRSGAAAYEEILKLLAKQKGKEARQQRLDALQQLASVYLFLKDYQQATSVYGRITALTPKDPQAFFDMATIAINAGDTNTALLAFTRFLALAPDSPDAPAVRDWIANNAPTATPSPSGGGDQ